jgi:hypothetical protein
MKKEDEDKQITSVEELGKTISGTRDKPPKWLGNDEHASWVVFPEWRSAFQSEKSRITQQLLFYTLRTIGIAVGASLIIAFFIWWTKSQTYFDLSILISIGNISSVTAAAVTSIILFFVVFFFGRAGELEDQARNSIRHEIASLELAADQISKWGSVQESVTDSSVRAKAEHLLDTSNKFYNGIRELIGVFSRARRGTFYDSGELSLLDTHIHVKGGDWYAAYRSVSDTPESGDFALKVLRDVKRASSNIIKLNDDIQLAQDQYHKALQVSFALPSLFIIVVLALAAIFVANVLPTGFSITLLSIILISLLTTQILLLVRWAYLLVYREVVVRRANRESDRKYSEKVTRVDTDEMMQDALSMYERVRGGTEEKKQDNNKPNGTEAGNS